MSYTSLFKRYADQNIDEVFAFFPYRKEKGDTWETPYLKLAKMTKSPQAWNFKSEEMQDKYLNQTCPILTNYLNYTFLRIVEQDKIIESEDGTQCCFNTGLQTTHGKDIFALFFRSTKENTCDWVFSSWEDSYSEKMSNFHPNPDIATYFEDASDLVFDVNLNIDPNIGHIVTKNIERFPEVLRGDETMATNAILGAIQTLKEKIRRNYKIAIPHWYDHKIQLLLPLVLTGNDNTPDLALVVDKDKNRNIYRGKTVLTLDQAYIDARIITSPDSDWLNP